MVKSNKVLNFVLFSFALVFYFPLFSQKKLPNKGIGISCNVTGFFIPNAKVIGVFPVPQLQYVYLPQPNTITSVAVGSFVGINNNDELRPLLPVWLTFNYLHLHNYNKKKKACFIYGGRLDMGIGEFTYASEPIGGAYEFYYKRILFGVSPQAGVWLKSRKKNFFTATLSVGISSTFFKITQAPAGSGYTSKIILPLSLRLGYNFLFKRKRR